MNCRLYILAILLATFPLLAPAPAAQAQAPTPTPTRDRTSSRNGNSSGRTDRRSFWSRSSRSSSRTRSPTSAPAAAPEAAVAGGTTWSSYAVVIDRNPFVRDHGRTEAPQIQNQGPPPPPERSIVLTGVALREGQYVAFFEDTRSGQTTRLTDGGQIARGQIRNITIAGVDYVRDSITTTVTVGRNLEDATIAAAPPSTAPSDNQSTAESEIEQRLRQRRLQELGG
jgi:hypothetical protein